VRRDKAVVEPVEQSEPLADGLAVGQVGVNAFALARQFVRRVTQVEESHLAQAIVRLMELEKSVVEGAGVYAGLLTTGSRRDPTRPGKLIGSSPRSLGILVRDERNQLQTHVVIPRNSVLPASTTFCVTTVRANQPRIRLRIVEADESGHIPLGSCVIEDLPPNLPADSVFDVALEYQTDGVLQVMARHQTSGLFANAVLIPEEARGEEHAPARS